MVDGRKRLYQTTSTDVEWVQAILESQSLDAITRCVDARANLSYEQDGQTVLEIATEKHDIDIIRRLLDARASDTRGRARTIAEERWNDGGDAKSLKVLQMIIDAENADSD